uniref:Uncharacterized protein n=1 Tax=Anguilla anguilla TaxID=7936 RepID=A0A0E9Y1W6_ANGAN
MVHKNWQYSGEGEGTSSKSYPGKFVLFCNLYGQLFPSVLLLVQILCEKPLVSPFGRWTFGGLGKTLVCFSQQRFLY